MEGGRLTCDSEQDYGFVRNTFIRNMRYMCSVFFFLVRPNSIADVINLTAIKLTHQRRKKKRSLRNIPSKVKGKEKKKIGYNFG